MDKMLEVKMHKIGEMKDSLTNCLKAEIDKGVEMVDAKEAGEVVDMIKDLAEAEKLCYEAEYYKTVIEAMEEEAEGEDNERAGYNRNRYANGRYAPKGRGRRGYKPYIDQMPYIDGYLNDADFMDNMRMGYSEGGKSSNGGMSMGNGNMSGYRGGDNSRYGKAYNDYKTSKRYYTSTKSAEDKSEMEQHAMEHMNDTMTTMREMWKDADTDMKKKLRANLSNLLGEMTI